MLHRILLGLDEGGAADHAARTISHLGRALAAEIEAVHAIVGEWRSASRSGATPDQHREEVENAARRSRSTHLRQLIGGDASASEPTVRISHGKPGKALLERASDWPADLIAIGGHRDLGLFHFGSTARTLLAKSACPVWVQATAMPTIRRILVAVDLSPHSIPVMDTAKALARGLGAQIIAFHCFVPPTFAYGEGYTGPSYVVDDLRLAEQGDFDEFVAMARSDDVPMTSTTDEGDPSGAILDHAADADLVVMGTHGHTSLLRTVLGSQAYRVIKKIERPVLAVPYPRREYQMD